MIPRAALRQRHGLLSSTSCLNKASATSPPSRRLAPGPCAALQPSFGYSQRRNAHTVPSLGPQNDAMLQDGIDGLISSDALSQNWTIYMKHLLARLNDLLSSDRDAGNQNKNLKQLLIEYARRPDKANIFNYASMAHNHHFYMHTISPKPNVPIPQDLEAHLDRCFSSVYTLRETFLDVANAMFGPGYVWLVLQWNASPYHPNTDHTPAPSRESIAAGGSMTAQPQGKTPPFDLRILPTYLAGSPYPGAHNRLQPEDNNTHGDIDKIRSQQVANGAGSFGKYNKGPSTGDATLDSVKRWSGADIMPLMCVSTWQHAYMQDWGIDGKKYFLEAWWDRIDWEKVWANAGREVSNRAASNREKNRRPAY